MFKAASSSFAHGKGPAAPTGAPIAALLPWNKKATDFSSHGYTKLTSALASEKLSDFVPRHKVTEAMAELGIPERTNMKNEQLQALASKLGADFVLWGNFYVIKSLTFVGMRQDITMKVRVFSAEMGKDYCRALSYQTGMLFVKPSHVKDGFYMTDLAVEHLLPSFKRKMNPDAPRPKSSREKAKGKKGRHR